MNRRKYLLGLVSATTLAAGCTTGSDSDPAATVDAPTTTENTVAQTDSTTQTTPAPSPTVEWDAVAGARIGNGHHYPPPALVDGNLIVASGLNDAGVIEAYNPDTGDREWTHATNASMNSDHPLAANDSVVVVGTDDGLKAIRASNGEAAWTEDMAVYGDPLAIDDAVYVPTAAGVKARGFDGEQLWTWNHDSFVNRVGSAGDAVYTKAGTSLYAIDVSDGSTIWEKRSTMELSTPPVVVDDLLLLGRENGHLTALQTESQNEKWDVNLAQSVSAPLGVGKNAVYAAGWSRALHALTSSDGGTKWTFSPELQTISAAVEVGDTVYVGGSNGLYARAVDDGSPQWTVGTDSAVWAPPLVEEDQLYLLTEAGGIFCISYPE